MTDYVEATPKDDRNYIDKVQSRAMDYGGKELSPEEMGLEFVKLGIDERVATMQSLAAETEPLSLHEAARRYGYERELRRIHELLRKAGR